MIIKFRLLAAERKIAVSRGFGLRLRQKSHNGGGGGFRVSGERPPVVGAPRSLDALSSVSDSFSQPEKGEGETYDSTNLTGVGVFFSLLKVTSVVNKTNSRK